MSERVEETSARRWQRPGVAGALLALALGLFVATGAAEFTAPSGSSTSLADVWWGLTLAVPFPVVGFLIARGVPGNPIGWLFLTAPPLLGLSAFLGAVGLLALLPTVIFGRVDGRADVPAWFVAMSTLVVFALFSPVRTRVRRRVERRFNRARYDAEAVVGAFAERVRDETDLGEVAGELGEIAATVVEPSFVGLWLRQA